MNKKNLFFNHTALVPATHGYSFTSPKACLDVLTLEWVHGHFKWLVTSSPWLNGVYHRIILHILPSYICMIHKPWNFRIWTIRDLYVSCLLLVDHVSPFLSRLSLSFFPTSGTDLFLIKLPILIKDFLREFFPSKNSAIKISWPPNRKRANGFVCFFGVAGNTGMLDIVGWLCEHHLLWIWPSL